MASNIFFHKFPLRYLKYVMSAEYHLPKNFSWNFLKIKFSLHNYEKITSKILQKNYCTQQYLSRAIIDIITNNNLQLNVKENYKASTVYRLRLLQRPLRELYSPMLGWLAKHRCIMDYLKKKCQFVWLVTLRSVLQS